MKLCFGYIFINEDVCLGRIFLCEGVFWAHFYKSRCVLGTFYK